MHHRALEQTSDKYVESVKTFQPFLNCFQELHRMRRQKQCLKLQSIWSWKYACLCCFCLLHLYNGCSRAAVLLPFPSLLHRNICSLCNHGLLRKYFFLKQAVDQPFYPHPHLYTSGSISWTLRVLFCVLGYPSYSERGRRRIWSKTHYCACCGRARRYHPMHSGIRHSFLNISAGLQPLGGRHSEIDRRLKAKQQRELPSRYRSSGSTSAFLSFDRQRRWV